MTETIVEIKTAEQAWEQMSRFPNRKTDTLRMLIANLIQEQPVDVPLEIRIDSSLALLQESYRRQPSVFASNLRLLLHDDPRTIRASNSDDGEAFIVQASLQELPTTFMSYAATLLEKVQKGEWVKIPWEQVPQSYVAQPRLFKWRMARRTKHPIRIDIKKTEDFLKIREIVS